MTSRGGRKTGRSRPTRVPWLALFFSEGAVERADDGLDRGELDVGVDPGAEERLAAGGPDLDVAHRARLRAGAERVLGVAEHLERGQAGAGERLHEGRDRA